MDSSYTSNALQELHLTPDIVIQAEGFLDYKAGALKYTNYKRLPLVRVRFRDTY